MLKLPRTLRAFLVACSLFVGWKLFGAPDATLLPDGAGKATMQKICSGCHAPEIVVGRHETKEGWERIVGNMVEKGANGTDDEFNTIIDYLAANFPKK